eukprot:m.12099 g.12099  ORF g.12099 m.12099 type:complete len:104 (+) comp4516_c0_seq2:1408-1719(+)
MCLQRKYKPLPKVVIRSMDVDHAHNKEAANHSRHGEEGPDVHNRLAFHLFEVATAIARTEKSPHRVHIFNKRDTTVLRTSEECPNPLKSRNTPTNELFRLTWS